MEWECVPLATTNCIGDTRLPMFFIPAPDGFGSLFPLAALLAGITILVLLGGWASRDSIQHRHGVAMRVPPVVFWITAVPMTVAIVFLALVPPIAPAVCHRGKRGSGLEQ